MFAVSVYSSLRVTYCCFLYGLTPSKTSPHIFLMLPLLLLLSVQKHSSNAIYIFTHILLLLISSFKIELCGKVDNATFKSCGTWHLPVINDTEISASMATSSNRTSYYISIWDRLTLRPEKTLLPLWGIPPTNDDHTYSPSPKQRSFLLTIIWCISSNMKSPTNKGCLCIHHTV